MDFITHLPASFGHTVIWVICDRLTKYVHFIALPTKFAAKDLAHRFSSEICRLHGVPKTITSDRDPLFLSQFWKELFRTQGTTLQYSTAYHPETDGQTEVVNRSLETYLRCFASDHPKHWFKFLHLAEFWYNSSFHTAIQMSPFEALYGRTPPTILDYVANQTPLPQLDSALQQRQIILSNLKQNLKRTRQLMEIQANQKRRDCVFYPGDRVLLRLQPYRQQTVQRRAGPKLSKRFFGPFTVLRRIGAVAYELDLPPSSKIHPVIHISQLRAYHDSHKPLENNSIPPEFGEGFSEEEDNLQDLHTHQNNSVAEHQPALDPTSPQQPDPTSPLDSSQPLDPITHGPSQTQSLDTIVSTGAPTLDPNLEDKVSGGPDSNVSKARTTRLTQKPIWSKDYVFNK
jgi:hypothetical protein